MPEPIPPTSFRLSQRQIAWLHERAEQQGQRGASSVLREILDREMAPSDCRHCPSHCPTHEEVQP